MTFVFKLILLASFIGLAIIVIKNRLANPQMRVQFFDDLEVNKRRFRNLGQTIYVFVAKAGQGIYHCIRLIIPYSIKGTLFVWAGAKKFLTELRKRLASQAKELRQDMKSFEIPSHKEDFLDKLDGGEKQETKVAPAPKRSLGERFLGRSFARVERKEPLTQFTPIIEGEPELKEVSPQGFQMTNLKEEHINVEAEVDKDILTKKEKWLLYAIAKNPKNTNFYKKLGRIYLQMNNLEDAKNCFEYALRLGSHDPEVKALLSELRHGM